MVAPQGFEPRYAAPEAAVLPLNEGAMRKTGKASRSLTLPILKAGSTPVNVSKQDLLPSSWPRKPRRLFCGNRKEDMLPEHELQHDLNDRRSFIKLLAAAP